MLVRSQRQLKRVMEHIRLQPGLVLFTLVNPELRRELESHCAQYNVPCQGVLDGPIAIMRQYLGASKSHRPGGQHEVDQRYLQRIEALNFTIAHDDGQSPDMLRQCGGHSRRSEPNFEDTKRVVYLAIRGIRAANVPIVPGIALPSQLFTIKGP